MAIGAIYQVKEQPVESQGQPQNIPQTNVSEKLQANTPQATPGTNGVPNEPEDLLSRVTKFVKEESPANKSDDQINEKVFSDTELKQKIEALRTKDPELAEMLELQRKSMITGLNGKFQELSDYRKQLEAEQSSRNEPKAKFIANSVQDLLNNPEFIKEAQSFQQEELSDEEREILNVKSEIQKLKDEQLSKEQQRIAQESHAKWNEQHDLLSQKYADYDKNLIDKTATDLVQGKMQTTPEHIYRVLNYEKYGENCYKMGIKEGSSKFSQKVNNSSMESVNGVQLDRPLQAQGEDNKNFLQRIIAEKLAGKQ